jgi:6-phosphogluconate dehydrogenase
MVERVREKATIECMAVRDECSVEQFKTSVSSKVLSKIRTHTRRKYSSGKMQSVMKKMKCFRESVRIDVHKSRLVSLSENQRRIHRVSTECENEVRTATSRIWGSVPAWRKTGGAKDPLCAVSR